MGECSTQELMEEQLSMSWQRNKLTIDIYLYIFKKGMWGDQLRSITVLGGFGFWFFCLP